MQELQLFDNDRMKKSIKRLEETYPDYSVNNELEIHTNGENHIVKEIQILDQSAKRNDLRDLIIKNSKIIGSSFSGSKFQDCTFIDSQITGNGFVCSNFKNFVLDSKDIIEYSANNFSKSYFDNCTFRNSTFTSSTWLDSEVRESIFTNCIIHSCTLEGACFKQCKLEKVDMSNTNLDYLVLDKSYLNEVIFPFYQFAYIIGIAYYLKCENSLDRFCFFAGDKTVTLQEYKQSIYDLIYYYYDRGEYFPICNLLYSVDDIENAKKFIYLGIKNALINNDFRLVKHFCKLGKHYYLIDYSLTIRIKEEIDRYLNQSTFTLDELNEALIKTSEINNILNEKSTGTTSLQIELQTNVDRFDLNSQQKIDNLISDCRYILQNPVFNIEGHTISEINYCPITLVLSIIGAAANLATIAGVFQQYFAALKTNKYKSSRAIAKHICKEYDNIREIDTTTRLKLAKAEIEKSMLKLKTYKGLKSGKKYDDFIDSITQKIVGDVDNILEKDMLVFSINND